MDKFIQSYLDGEDISVDGTGVQKRDFVHIMDVVALYAKIALNERVRSGVYNVGGGEIISIRELAYLINDIGERVFQYRVPLSFGKNDDSSDGWHDFVYDHHRAKMEFQYDPIFRISDYVKERVLDEARGFIIK